jgi:hypothetical protein
MTDPQPAPGDPLVTRALRKIKRDVGNVVKKVTGDEPVAHDVKRAQVRSVAAEFGLKILVETGTFQGDMVEAMRQEFDQIISIEVFPPLHEKAKIRFASYPHIQLLLGDSGVLMPDVVARLTGPALFWLDGHYSGGGTGKGASDTPIMHELKPILSDTRFGHAILIDDARLFKGKDDYPTIPEVAEVVEKLRPGSRLFVRSDAIVIYPRQTARS